LGVDGTFYLKVLFVIKKGLINLLPKFQSILIFFERVREL